MKTRLLILIFFCHLSLLSSAQETEKQEEVDLYSLSLEELMNIPIESVSKKSETLFDAPLSSYTIRRADIDRSGATSIVEALRMAPGIIVREQTNGVYDVHIRGFDNILGSGETYAKSSFTTLVMIDNRPVFNHNLGGTFWEALPVDINDVERIEIIRGPSAPLFGPNAVTGVINIITKRVEKDKTLVFASVQGGAPSTMIANASVGKNFGKFTALVSGNFQKRERFSDEYYVPAANDYFTTTELTAIGRPNIDAQYPDPLLALDKFGVNVNLNYDVSEKIKFNLATGTQQATSQKIFLANVFNGGILFTTNETETSYVNLSSEIHGFNIRGSYLSGHDDLALKASPNQYDYDVFEANAEYAFKIGERGSIVPGISYQSAVYGDKEYVSEGLTFLNGTEQSINTTSGFLRADVSPVKALRIMAAVRGDKFSVPDDVYLAYEFAATYKLTANHLIRAAVTRSNSGSFIGNNYLNLRIPNQPAPGLTYVRSGRQDLELLTVDMIEIGYRAQLDKSLQLDLDVFQQRAQNFSSLLTKGLQFPNYVQEFDNVPTTAEQRGITLSINYIPNQKLQIKPFVTAQKTEVDQLPSTFDLPNGDPGVTYYSREHKNTPSVYGGYFINYKLMPNLNLNLNGYYFAKHRQYDQSDDDNIGEAGDIKGVFLLNAKINWAVTKQFNVFANARNIMNSDSREFFGADQTGGLFLAGASFNLN